MKRLIAILLCLVMLLSLAACGNDDTQSTDPSTEPSQTTTETTEAQTDETTEPTTEPTECSHEYKDSVTTEATCTAEGVKTFTCTKCGDSYTEAIEKSEHTYKDATCTDAKTCSACGATEGEALGHSYNKATCTKAETCSRCGSTKGSALGHNYKDATCTTPKTCSRCGATSGKALGHTHKAVTCTEGATCTVCGTVIPAAGHSYKDATCTAPKTCATCGATEGNALGHSYKDATCTAPKTCSTCGATEGSAAEHNWNAATCTAPKTCSVCGATEGDAAGHNWNAATCTAPKTCSVCGATEGSATGHNYQNGVCTGCGDVETITHPFGTGTGYAITVSSDGTEISCYQISCDELYFTGYSAEKPTEGYYVFREYNGTTYYAPAPSWGWLSVSSYTISGRTVQLQAGPETMELELISANQYKVTKGVESIPAGIVFTFGSDMCSFMGHLYERSCENDVTCMFCGHVKCEGGLGHEYGEDGICFRCYAAMRPSN